MNSLKNGIIPKILWQTYKTTEIPNQAKPLINSWFKLNTDLQWYFMDDDSCERFIKDHFNQEFYEMYMSLPLGVMRADVWRVAVVYVYGGIYADTDCECVKPISEWIKPDDELIVGIERPNGALLNFVFAASPRHPALLSVLNGFIRLRNHSEYLNRNEPTPVQNFGQFGFSNGILSYYNNNDSKNIKILPYHEHIFSPTKYHTSAVVHHTASERWKNGYDSWRVRVKELFKK